MGWECFCEVGFDLGPLLQGQTRILHLQYFFKYVLAYFLHLNNYLVTFLHNPICGAQLICPSVSFGISFEHVVQLPFTVLLYSTFPSVGIGARSFNIDRSSHRTADIDKYYQHFNIETTYKKQTKTK